MYYSARGKDLTEQKILDISTSQKFLDILASGKEPSMFFEKNKIKKIAIAPFNYFTKCLIKTIDSEKIEVACIYDKQYYKFPQGFRNIKISSYSEIEKEDAEMYLVTSNYYQNDIIDTLISKGVSIDKIIGINTVLFGMEYM